MDRPITITPSEMYTAIMAVCGTITAVAAAIAVIAKVIERMRKPNKTYVNPDFRRAYELESDKRSQNGG